MNITIDILIDCIFLLINSNTEDIRKTVQGLIELFNKQTSSVMLESDRELSKLYIKLLQSIIDQKIDKSDKLTLKAALFKLKSTNAYKENKTLLLELEKEFLSDDIMSDISVAKQHKSLKLIHTQIVINNLMKRSFAELSNLSNKTEYNDKLKSLKTLQSLFSQGDLGIQRDITDEDDFMNSSNFVNFADKKSVSKQLDIHHSKTKITNIYKTGLQGLNNFCKYGGFLPGQSIIFAAGPSKFKSGILKKFFLWCVEFNDIKPTDPKKIPMVYFATLENTTDDNTFSLYETLYANEHGKMPSNDSMTKEEQDEYISNYFKKRNIFFAMEKFPSGEFSSSDLKNRILTFAKLGYEVKIVILDYLAEMKRDNSAARDLSLKASLVDCCDFCKMRSITLVSAHPFNRNYASVLDQPNGIKKVNLQHLADGPDVARVADTVIFINIETNDVTNIKYLTMYLYKNRLYGNIPESKRYCAYPFYNDSILRDDYNTNYGGVSDIYKDTRFTASLTGSTDEATASDSF